MQKVNWDNNFLSKLLYDLILYFTITWSKILFFLFYWNFTAN